MKRPLCCVCLAFVAAVFLYLFSGLLPAEFVSETQGSQLAITGELYNKEYKNGSLVLYLRHVKKKNSAIQNFSKQTEAMEYENDISVMCYMDNDIFWREEDIRLGAWVVVEGEVSLLKTAGNPGEFDAAAHYRTLVMRK